MPARSNDYGIRVLLSFAWPVIVARSSQAVIGFCDALMTAPLGEEELASVTTGSMNTFTLTILPMGIVFIGQSFAAQLLGTGRVTVAVRYAWYGLIIALGAGILAVSAIPLIGPTLDLLDYDPRVHRLMTDYIEIRLLAIGAVVATEALGNWYGGLGNTRLHMAAGLIAMVTNVFLNWVLITGNLGAPALGVEGAAIASVIATWSGFALLALVFATGVAVPGRAVRPRGLLLGELMSGKPGSRFSLPLATRADGRAFAGRGSVGSD
ncbi:MAG: MATE family efflux transporter [Myxococcota bacterium]